MRDSETERTVVEVELAERGIRARMSLSGRLLSVRLSPRAFRNTDRVEALLEQVLADGQAAVADRRQLPELPDQLRSSFTERPR